MESSKGSGDRPKAEDVISKLKDDGDFDDLRLKIVRKIKENENLRSLIISEVKQSESLNRQGAENLKPRQLSDAIHEEIGNKIMGHISDELWTIIRSDNGMRDEIRDSVRFTYEKLEKSLQKKSNVQLTPSNIQSSLKNYKLPEPPVFVRPSEGATAPVAVVPGFTTYQQLPTAEHKEEEIRSSLGLAPGFALQQKVESVAANCDAEDDPDLPPGFG